MILAEAVKLAQKMIYNDEKHQDYPRVTELADDYHVFITGKGIDKKLIQVASRETAEAFEQRVKLTKAITPAVASSLRQPFNKVTRNDRIRKNIEIGAESRKRNTKDMMSMFYGSSKKENRGLDYYMKTRFLDLQFIDPNSWVVIEWDATPPNEPIRPRPFEVSSYEAVNFSVTNDEVRWLFVKQGINVKKYDPTINAPYLPAGGVLPDGINPPIKKEVYNEGCRYTLYDEDFTIVFEQVDIKKGVSSYELRTNQGNPLLNEEYIEVRGKTYLVKKYTPMLGFPPAFRVGYKRDDVTKSRTFVNPWHDALCYFEKSLKTVSELDLTMSLHVFPKLIQYVPKCAGPSRNKKCNSGLLPDGTTCPACKGVGYKPIPTSAQDAILIPMPDDPKDMLDLEKFSVTKSPPIDLVKWQNEYILQLETQSHQAVFNSQALIKKTTNKEGVGGDKTATEVDANMQSIYDTLEPFTEKYSEFWIDVVITFALLSGENINNISVSHDFPADFKLKNSDTLLSERKTATDSGAPAFLLNTIDDDLATIVYAGDGLGLQKFRVKSKFFPFPGNTPDEITMALLSEFVPKEQKVLYYNFDQIFKDIEFTNPEFWVMVDLKKQREMVEAKVMEVSEKLKSEKPEMTINMLRDTNPAVDKNQNNDNADSNSQNPAN